MVEPTTSVSAWSKIGAALKDWPLWLLAGAAASATVFVLVPPFRGSVNATTLPLVYFAAVALWILSAFRAIAPAVQVTQVFRRSREAGVSFVVTPVPEQCAWGITRQADGSLVTQISGHFMVRNRTGEPLYLMRAEVKKPTIKGDVLTSLVLVRAPSGPMHGTAHVSGHHVPPRATLPASLTLLIRGAPRQTSGTLDATLALTDADGHHQRVRTNFRFIGPQPSATPIALPSPPSPPNGPLT